MSSSYRLSFAPYFKLPSYFVSNDLYQFSARTWGIDQKFSNSPLSVRDLDSSSSEPASVRLTRWNVEWMGLYLIHSVSTQVHVGLLTTLLLSSGLRDGSGRLLKGAILPVVNVDIEVINYSSPALLETSGYYIGLLLCSVLSSLHSVCSFATFLGMFVCFQHQMISYHTLYIQSDQIVSRVGPKGRDAIVWLIRISQRLSSNNPNPRWKTQLYPILLHVFFFKRRNVLSVVTIFDNHEQTTLHVLGIL